MFGIVQALMMSFALWAQTAFSQIKSPARKFTATDGISLYEVKWIVLLTAHHSLLWIEILNKWEHLGRPNKEMCVTGFHSVLGVLLESRFTSCPLLT